VRYAIAAAVGGDHPIAMPIAVKLSRILRVAKRFIRV
jgi:hypothetical protein